MHGGFGVLVERRTRIGGVDGLDSSVGCIAEQAYTIEVDTAGAASPCRAVLAPICPFPVGGGNIRRKCSNLRAGVS